MNTPETETPRTDAVEVFRPNHEGQGVGWVHANFARTLERENAQLRKELEEAQRKLTKPTPDELALCKWYKEAIADRDRFKSLAQTNWQMAQDAVDCLIDLMHNCPRTHPWGEPEPHQSNADKANETLSRFQTQKAKQLK